MKRSLKITIKLVLSIIFILFILSQIDISELIETFRNISLTYIVPAIVFSFLGYLSRAFAWGRILQERTSETFSFILSLASINTVLPMKVGRAGAPALLKRFFPRMEKEDAVGGAVLTTFLYAALYTVFVFIGVTTLQLPQIIFFAAIAAGGIYLLICSLLFLLRKREISKGVVDKIINLLPDRFKFESEGTRESFANLLKFENISIYSSMWILCFIFFQGIRVFLIFEAFGFSFPHPWLLFILPIIAYSVTIIPASLGGIGLAELSAYIVYQSFDVPSSIAISVVLIDRFILIYLPAIIGALILGKREIK